MKQISSKECKFVVPLAELVLTVVVVDDPE
jgi:hypothetical protein